MTAAAKPRFRLTAPVVLEHPLQKTICDVLRLEIAPAGKVSLDGVCWWGVDHANFAGEIPGIRIGRGIIAGIPDLFLLHRGRSFFIEIKSETGQLSPAQMSVGAAIMAAGGQIGVVTTVESVLACLDEWKIPRAHRVRP
jgi:hypothetical protein